jgi:hypothetical protein
VAVQTLIAALLTLPTVVPHDSRVAGEVALKAPAAAMRAAIELVEQRLGPAAKPAGERVGEALQTDPLLERLGGLRADQTLYRGDAFYVAFWPWSGGTTTTIKIGPVAS